MLINKYTEFMDNLYETINNTNDNNFKEFVSKSLIDFINGLYAIEKDNKVDYENLLKKYNLGKDKLKNITDNKEDEKIKNDKLDKYKNELANIFKNPNEESINVWLKNIISYANENKIEKDEINNFIKDSFNEFDKENKFIDKLDKYILEINGQKENELTKDDEKNDLNNKDLEDYVAKNILNSNNKELKDDFVDALFSLEYGLKNNDKITIDFNTDKYLRFIDKYKDVLDKEKMINYLNNIYLKYGFNFDELMKSIKKDNENKENTKSSEDNKKDSEPLKIKRMKKSFNSKIKNKALALTALASLSVFTINPLFGIALGIGGYKLYKRGVKNANKLIEKNGYTIDNNDNLIDRSGKIITEDDISKLKYNLIREELKKVKEGKINKEYKKNRLTSLLLNNKLVNSVKNKFNTIKNDDYESPQLVKDINKGMRHV